MKSVSCLQTGAVCEIMSFLATDNLFQFLRYSKKCQPDLFVLDLDMKDVSGWEVAGMLASDEG